MNPPGPIQIIKEQGACLILNKPGGLLTQAPPGIDSLELRVKQLLKIRDNKPGKVYLGVPHRLDRPAAGIMVMAKNVRAANRLADQFQQRTIEKKYWAVVEGNVEPRTGHWVDFMKKMDEEAKSIITEQKDPKAKIAELKYTVLAKNENCSWLEIELLTGRTHQIRLQCSHRGHPILGDLQYGAAIEFGPQTTDVRKRWIALHARELKFEHPIERESMHFTAPLWQHWNDLDFQFE